MAKTNLFTGLKNVLTKNKKTTEEGIQDVSKNVSGEISEDFQNNESEVKELNETDLQSLQKEILHRAKTKGQSHHYEWLKTRTDKLIVDKDEKGLKALNEKIDFTENQGLMLKTPEGRLKFKPKQATYKDVEGIKGLKEAKNILAGENIWTNNPKMPGKKGLRANIQAVQKMINAGKKMCTAEQYIGAINIFPGGVESTKDRDNPSTKVKDFFDLLGVEQYGSLGHDYTRHSGNNRSLWSMSIGSSGAAYSVNCQDSSGRLSRSDRTCGIGVWFLEDDKL